MPRWAAHQDTRYSLTGTLLWLCVDVSILLMVADGLVLFVCTALTKLKMQLEVSGSTGNLTGAADRKLEEGQRVSYCCTITNAVLFWCMWASTLKRATFGTLSSQNLRQLRVDLQRLGVDLQSGERACCRNTGGERLRQALNVADETLAKQVHYICIV